MSFLRCLLPVLVILSISRIPAADAPVFGFQDFLLVPVRVHLLSSEDTPALHTTLTGGDVERIFQKANRVWAPAGIQFFVESLQSEPAEPAKVKQDPDPTKRVPAGLDAMLEHMLRPAGARRYSMFIISSPSM